MKHPHRTFMKYFFKQLFIIAIPIILLGTLSFYLTYYDIRQTTYDSISKSLDQSRQFMNQLLLDGDTIEATFNPDSFSGFSLKHILKEKELTYKNAVRYPIFSSILNTFVNTNSTIESVYLYWPNDYENLLVSNRGLTALNNMEDINWFDTYKFFSNETQSTRKICLRHQKNSNGVLPTITIYQKFMSLDYQTAKGMAIINIKPSLIENYLLQQCSIPTQQIYLFTDDWSLLASSDKDVSVEAISSLAKSASEAYTSTDANINDIHIKEKDYTISILNDHTAPLFYISAISNHQLYSTPTKLLYITGILIAISAIIALCLAISYSRTISHNIHGIIDIFHAAQNGSPLPLPPVSSNDEQTYIITNLISTFIKQEYLTIQLSEKAYRAKALELVALQSQINPHFLFNTLETIRLKSFNLANGSNDVSMLIENLSDILRYTLSNPNERVSLKNEIAYSKAYIFIQKFRYKDKFHVIWEYDSDILAIPVIKLLIQPLLENSIHHGIAPSNGECLIKVKIFQRKGVLHLHIIDNGIGISAQKKAELHSQLLDKNTSYQHIGLSNTWKRLTLIYGNNAKIYIWSKKQLGTAIILILPVS